MNNNHLEKSQLYQEAGLLNVLVLGQGKSRLSVESLLGPRVREDLDICQKVTMNPREADVLIVTGPIGPKMEQLILSVYEAMIDPKSLIVAGTEALNGGLFDEFTMGKRHPLWEKIVPDAILYGTSPCVQEFCEAFHRLRTQKFPESNGETATL